MKNLSLIKEASFPVKERKWAVEYIGRRWPDEPLQDDYNAYSIYYKSGGEIDRIYFQYGDILGKGSSGDDLVSHLKRFRPGTFKEVMFLLDIYTERKRLSSFLGTEADLYLNKSIEDKINEFHRHKTPAGEAIESILEDTKGFILWHHQLESIINIFVSDLEEVVRLRKGFNAKRPDALGRLESFHVDRGTTLDWFICKRLVWINGTTISTNINGAFKLFKLLR